MFCLSGRGSTYLLCAGKWSRIFTALLFPPWFSVLREIALGTVFIHASLSTFSVKWPLPFNSKPNAVDRKEEEEEGKQM